MHQKGFVQAFLLIILLLGLGIGVYLVQQKQIFFSRAQTPKASFEPQIPKRSTSQQKYGFNTHLTTGRYGYYENLDVNAFKKNVDESVNKKLTWIRFSINSGEIVPSGDIRTINWNEQNLAVYKEAIDYAKSKGLSVYLVTDVPFFAKDYSVDDYKKVAQIYYSRLAAEFAGKIGLWQIFNEADTHTYNEYKPIDDTIPLDANYLNTLKDIVTTIRQTIRSSDRKVPITMNVSGYPISAKERTFDRWVQFYDVLGSRLDWLALDMYPDKDPNGQQLLIQRVNDISSKYGKKVAVAEIGMCTATFSEADQAVYMPEYIQALKNSEAKVVILYEYQDEGAGDNCEETFGIKKVDGSFKPAYEPVMNSLVPVTP